MSLGARLDSLPRPSGAPVRLGPDFRLPLRAAEFDAVLAGLLHAALNGQKRGDILADLCQQLARLLSLRLAVLARRVDSGSLAMEGASAENALWLDLQRIPERWDSGLSSLGPAGEAVRQQTPVRMGALDEGFALWRAGAATEQVQNALALPLHTAPELRVLELYFGGDIHPGASRGTLTISQLARRLETFLADLATLEQLRLIASALACAGNAALVTDLDGTIVWNNAAFTALSGYTPGEVRGRNPSLLRSGEQGLRYYRDLWGTIRAGDVWSGETVDRAKDGSTYTIHQTVSPVSQDGRVTHYVSIQHDIGRERKARADLELAKHEDHQTGLLTPAAFAAAAQQALADAGDRPVAFVIVSLRGLRRAGGALGEDLQRATAMEMGKRVRAAVPASDIAGDFGGFEYGVLLRGDVSPEAVLAQLRVLDEKLAEPLPYLGDLPELGVHFGTATATATTLRELRLKADRQLADEPYRPAHRTATH